MQPDNPADLGNKIYDMMAMAVGGRWGRLESEEAEPVVDSSASESDGSPDGASETEVIEPSEVRAENDPWKDWAFFQLTSSIFSFVGAIFVT